MRRIGQAQQSRNKPQGKENRKMEIKDIILLFCAAIIGFDMIVLSVGLFCTCVRDMRGKF